MNIQIETLRENDTYRWCESCQEMGDKPHLAVYKYLISDWGVRKNIQWLLCEECTQGQVDNDLQDNMIRRLHPIKSVLPEEQEWPIGYTLGKEFLCQECVNWGNHEAVIPMYRVNIGDYKQTCHRCSKVVVQGKTEAWPELFPKQGTIEKFIPFDDEAAWRQFVTPKDVSE